MPRTTREWAKRKLTQVQGNIEWAGAHLKEVTDVYDEQHPEITEPIKILNELLITVYNALDEINDMI